MAAFLLAQEGKARGSKGNWLFDSRSSKEQKRDWIDSQAIYLISRGHTRSYARRKAKEMYRDLSR